MSFLTILQIVLALLPLIIEAIVAVEKLIPEKGSGETKLAIVKAVFESAQEAEGVEPEAAQEVWPVAESLIGRVVGIFNAVGIFKK